MTQRRISLTGRFRHFFIIYCIGGGFLAFALLLSRLGDIAAIFINGFVGEGFELTAMVMFFFYALTLSLLGIYCGIKLADNSPLAKRYLVYYLIPQIPFISFPGLIYYFKFGMSFTCYFAFSTEIEGLQAVFFNSSIGSYFNLNTDIDATLNQILIGINLVPVTMLLFIYKAHRNELELQRELEIQREIKKTKQQKARRNTKTNKND